MITPPPTNALRAVYARVFVVALLLRAVAAARAESLYPDGAVELELARALVDGRWSDALATRFHPLFACLVAAPGALGLPLEQSAIFLTVVVSALAAPVCAFTASRLAPGAPLSAATLAGLAAAAQPWLVRLGGQVMAYGTAHAALALALALATVAVARPGFVRGLACGAAIGLGFLARSDALATGAGLAVAVTLAAGRRGAARVAVGLALGALVVMSPYLIAMRLHAGEWRLSLKKRVDQVVRLPAGERPPPAPAPPGPLGLDELVRLEVEGGDLERALDTTSTTPPLVDACWFSARKAVSAGHPLLLALALLGLLASRASARNGPALKRLAAPRSPSSPLASSVARQGASSNDDFAPSSPSATTGFARGSRSVSRQGLVAPAALLAFVGVHALLKANWGYTSTLHQSGVGVLVAPLAGVGAAWLLARVPAPRRAHARRALLVALLGVLVPKALEPQLRGKQVERAIGPSLRARAGEGPLVIAGRDARIVAHDAGADYVDVRDVPGAPKDALAILRARGVRYLVVFLRRKGRVPSNGGAPRLEAALAVHGVLRADAPWSGEGEDGARYDWLLFWIP